MTSNFFFLFPLILFFVLLSFEAEGRGKTRITHPRNPGKEKEEKERKKKKEPKREPKEKK